MLRRRIGSGALASQDTCPNVKAKPASLDRNGHYLPVASWFYVHPACGLVETDPGSRFSDFAPRRWHPGGADSQEEAENRFLAALLEFFAASGTTFEADIPVADDQQRVQHAAAAAGLELNGPRRGVLAGPLHPALAEAFPTITLAVLSVADEGVERLHIHDELRETFVRLDERGARELRSLLDNRGLLFKAGGSD